MHFSGTNNIQRWLVSIETRDVVTQSPDKGRQTLWPAQNLQQKIGRGVITPLNSGRANVGEHHPALLDVLFAHRRIFQQIGLAVLDLPIQIVRAPIDALQNRGRRQELERAAHAESLTATMVQVPPGRGVKREHAQPPTFALLERGDPINGTTRTRGALRAIRGPCTSRRTHISAVRGTRTSRRTRISTVRGTRTSRRTRISPVRGPRTSGLARTRHNRGPRASRPLKAHGTNTRSSIRGARRTPASQRSGAKQNPSTTHRQIHTGPFHSPSLPGAQTVLPRGGIEMPQFRQIMAKAPVRLGAPIYPIYQNARINRLDHRPASPHTARHLITTHYRDTR
jgi:hypothetical protein